VTFLIRSITFHPLEVSFPGSRTAGEGDPLFFRPTPLPGLSTVEEDTIMRSEKGRMPVLPTWIQVRKTAISDTPFDGRGPTPQHVGIGSRWKWSSTIPRLTECSNRQSSLRRVSQLWE
jgi:hypothetical protein